MHRSVLELQIWSSNFNIKPVLSLLFLVVSCVQVHEADGELQLRDEQLWLPLLMDLVWTQMQSESFLLLFQAVWFMQRSRVGLDSFFFFFSPFSYRYCGICAETNLVHNDSDPVIQASTKEDGACQEILELFDGILWKLWGAVKLWHLSSCSSLTGRMR